jgi:hypothetical protein
MKSNQGAGQGAPTNDTEGHAIKPCPLVLRISPALLELGLRREISWSEAAHVLDALEHFDERDAARWRRQEQLIAEYEARQSA